MSPKFYLIGDIIQCRDKTCCYRKECSVHETAGDFRSEDGFSPQLVLDGNSIKCLTKFKRPLEGYDDEDRAGHWLPHDYDELGSGLITKSSLVKYEYGY